MPVASGAADDGAIRAEVDRVLKAFQESTDAELLSAIGSIPLNPAFTNVSPPEQMAGFGTSGFGLARLGQVFVDTNKQVRDVICNNKEAFAGVIDAANVSAVVAAILPALGVAAAVAPPAAAIALAVFILKIGLNQYCTGWKA